MEEGSVEVIEVKEVKEVKNAKKEEYFYRYDQNGRKIQHIADALACSTQAEVIRTFDDEGRRRILTCRLPNREG